MLQCIVFKPQDPERSERELESQSWSWALSQLRCLVVES